MPVLREAGGALASMLRGVTGWSVRASSQGFDNSPGRARRELPSDFDPAVYLALNRDVAAAGADAAKHYLTHGRSEGRPYRRDDLNAPYSADGLYTQHNHEFMAAAEFKRAYERGVKATQDDYQWHWRVHIGLWAAQSALHLPGDFVECGVNRGFLSSSIMEALRWNELARTFFLLDTFSGLDPRSVSADEVARGALEKSAALLREGFYTDNVSAVRANFAEWKNVRIIAGAIPETLPQVTTEQVAFLHIDLNCAPPEIAAIEYLWPRLVPGAFVLLDDYAYNGFAPQKVAMDAFAKRVGVVIASLPTGQGLLIRPPK